MLEKSGKRGDDILKVRDDVAREELIRITSALVEVLKRAGAAIEEGREGEARVSLATSLEILTTSNPGMVAELTALCDGMNLEEALSIVLGGERLSEFCAKVEEYTALLSGNDGSAFQLQKIAEYEDWFRNLVQDVGVSHDTSPDQIIVEESSPERAPGNESSDLPSWFETSSGNLYSLVEMGYAEGRIVEGSLEYILEGLRAVQDPKIQRLLVGLYETYEKESDAKLKREAKSKFCQKVDQVLEDLL